MLLGKKLHDQKRNGKRQKAIMAKERREKETNVREQKYVEWW